MKRKFIIIAAGAFVFGGVLARELGFITVERFSDSTVRYSLVKSSSNKLPGPHEKIVVRGSSTRGVDKSDRTPGVLYVYVDGFVFSQSLGCLIPLYKRGVSESYLRFEFVLDERTYAGGIVSVKAENRTVGLRSVRGARDQEFRRLVETILKYHGAGEASFAYSGTRVEMEKGPSDPTETTSADVIPRRGIGAAPFTSVSHL